jgi:hypothetical protein
MCVSLKNAVKPDTTSDQHDRRGDLAVRRGGAFIGEIEAARLAGMIAATNAQTESDTAATPIARGSQN